MQAWARRYSQRNKEGNYVFESIYRVKGGAVDQDRIIGGLILCHDSESDMDGADIIISNNPDLSMVKRVINGKDITCAYVDENPSVTLLGIPHYDIDPSSVEVQKSKSPANPYLEESPAMISYSRYSSQCYFYNKNGDIID